MKTFHINKGFFIVVLTMVVLTYTNMVYGQLDNTQTMTKSGTTAA